MTHGVRGPVVTVTAAVMLLVATACGRQEITSYSVPKEETGPPPPAADPHRGSAPSAPQLRWEVPAGWEEQAAGGMRLARFRAPGAQKSAADVAVVSLPGVAGREVDVVNIYRDRLRLPPLDESVLAAMAKPVAVGAGQGRLFDMAGEADGTNAQPRMLVAELVHSGSSWYFTMTGDATVVGEQKPAFLEFLKSVAY